MTTADFLVTELDSKKLLDEIYKYNPSEIVCNEAFLVSGFPLDEIRERLHLVVSSLDAVYFDEKLSTDLLLKHFKTNSLESLGLREFEIGTIAAGALLKYLYEIQKSSLEHMTHIRPYINGNYMMLDHATRRNLELVETLREKQKRGSLLWVLDKTKTAMGARTLRSYIEQPLNDYDEIIRRHKAIEEINRQMITREELREYLNPIYDLERIMTKVIYQTANPRDLLAFKTSIAMLPPIKSLLADYRGDLLRQICEDLDPLEDLHALIDASISEDPPISVRDGDIIKDGYSEDIDHYRDAKTKGKQWLADLEIKEREKTGIKNLKVKYNKVFGYYLEVTNSYKDLVPGLLYPKTDPGQRGALFYAGAEGAGGYNSGGRRQTDHIGVRVFPGNQGAYRLPDRAHSEDCQSGGESGCLPLSGLRGGDKPLLQAQDEQKGHHRYQERTASGGGEDDPQRYVH